MCGATTIKYLLFVFNLIFALGGLAILVVGAIIQWNLANYGEFFSGQIIIAPSIILIVAGSLIFLISFFGCCGAIRESHCMIITFAVLLAAVFLLQIAGAVLAFIYHDEIKEGLYKGMKESQNAYVTPGEEGDAAREAWDDLQETFKCCGVMNGTEWTLQYGILPPESCHCPGQPLLTPGCEVGFYTTGCYQKFLTFVETAEIILGAVAISVAVIELIGVVFALVLANAIKNQRL